jgi:hypothetical protein
MHIAAQSTQTAPTGILYAFSQPSQPGWVSNRTIELFMRSCNLESTFRPYASVSLVRVPSLLCYALSTNQTSLSIGITAWSRWGTSTSPVASSWMYSLPIEVSLSSASLMTQSVVRCGHGLTTAPWVIYLICWLYLAACAVIAPNGQTWTEFPHGSPHDDANALVPLGSTHVNWPLSGVVACLKCVCRWSIASWRACVHTISDNRYS